MLPIARNEKLGTFSFYGQLSGKLATCLCVHRTALETYAPAARDNNSTIGFGEFATWIWCSAVVRSWPRLCEKSHWSKMRRIDFSIAFLVTAVVGTIRLSDRRKREGSSKRKLNFRLFTQPGPKASDSARPNSRKLSDENRKSYPCLEHFSR